MRYLCVLRSRLAAAQRPVLASLLKTSLSTWLVVGLVAASTVVASSAWASAEPEVTTLAGPLDGGVGGVAVDALGFVYVADFGETVWKIDPFGEVTVFADGLYGSSGNAIDSQGRLLQASFNGNYLSRIERNGEAEVIARDLQGPVGVTTGADGSIFICNCRGNSISRLTPEGEVVELASGDLFNCPNGIVSQAGVGEGASETNLYVVNFSDGRMIRVAADGTANLHAVIPGGGNGHIARIGEHFYVTGFRSNRIYRVDAEGDVTAVGGDGTPTDSDGPLVDAKFASPNGIAYDPARDALYLNDYLTPFRDRLRVPKQSSVRKIAFPTLTESFRVAMASGGLDAGIEAYRAYKTSRPGRFTEIEVNILAYGLLQAGQTEAAIRVFELNTEDYPQSFNAWDSLGEGHKAAGNREQAIEFYRKSLELNPANANAETMLRELGAEP